MLFLKWIVNISNGAFLGPQGTMFMLFASWPVLGHLGPLHRVNMKGAIWENNGKENGARNTTFVHVRFKNHSDDFTKMLYP